MNKLNLKINLDKLTEDERKTFMSLVEKTEKDEQEWEDGDDLFYIALDGTIQEGTYLDASKLDKKIVKFGNAYKTKEEAEKKANWQKIRNQLEKFAKENNEYDFNWKDNFQDKYCIYYDHFYNLIDISEVGCGQFDEVYFSSADIARKAIDYIGKDRLKKDYFKVKE